MANYVKKEYYKGVFPSPIAPDSEKNTEDYGRAVGRAIFGDYTHDDQSYYVKRNTIIKENRLFAAGRQPLSTYLALMDIDPVEAFVNLQYHPRPIAPKFRDIMVNNIMQKQERIKVKGLSLEINDRKEQKKVDAAFRMKEGKFIGDLQQGVGVELEDPNDFTPETEEELDIWSKMNDEEKEEMLMVEGVNFVFTNNGWEEKKKEIAESFVDTGFAFTRNYFNGAKAIKAKVIRPEQMLYDGTSTLTFDKGAHIGHIERMTISDVRLMWPDLKEEDIYKVAKGSMNINGNGYALSDWNYLWETDTTRPYDGFNVDVLFFEYRVSKFVNVLKTVDKNNRKIVEYVKEGYDAQGKRAEDKELNRQPIPTIYSGAWIIGSSLLPEWGEQFDVLRNNENSEDVAFSYTGYMLNNMGDMFPTAPVAAMKSSIIQMELSILKIQQHLATIAPDGARIDIDSATELDLGAGVGKIGYMKLRQIRQQTGDEFWSSKSFDGERNRSMPIEQAMHAMGDKIPQFINVYNFELNNIRDYIAINEVADGSGVNPRIGLQVMNNQMNVSNTGTGHIYGGYVYVYGNTAKGIGLRLWDTLKFADVNSMYVRILGKQNIDFIKRRKDITSSNYDLMTTVDMSADDKQFMDAALNSALQAGTIKFEDAAYIRKVTNFDLAIKYLSLMEKKRAKEVQRLEMEKADHAQQMNAEIQDRQVADKAALQKEMYQAELQTEQIKSDFDHRMIMQKLINDAVLKTMESGVNQNLPDYVQTLVNQQIKDDQAREQQEQDAAADEAAAQEDEMLMAGEQ